MGKSSGSVRGGANNAITEQGYTAKMRKNILGIERQYRNNKDESLHVFTADGDKVITFGGKGAQVTFNTRKVPADSILTHNHPRSIGAKGIRAIGNSFSKADIKSAIAVNAKELRAVTPTYTFSLKRPASGWGVSEKAAGVYFTRVNNRVNKEMIDYLNKVGWKQDNIARAEVTHFHKVMQAISKKYGWNYTKKRG